MQDIKIGLVQMDSQVGEPAKNFSRIQEYVIAAAKARVEILCFPEMCLQGYAMQSPVITSVASSGSWMKNLQKLAAEHKMVLLAGFAESNKNGQPYISQYIAFPNKEPAVYRKSHLGKKEEQYYSAGDDIPVFSYEKAVFSVQLCWEAHFPEISTIQALKGAEIIFMPHAAPQSVNVRRKIWQRYLPARAYDNSVFVCACNSIGKSNGTQFGGGAVVYDPKGEIIGEDFSGEEGMLTVNLPSSLLNNIRRNKDQKMTELFMLARRRPELYPEIIKTK